MEEGDPLILGQGQSARPHGFLSRKRVILYAIVVVAVVAVVAAVVIGVILGTVGNSGDDDESDLADAESLMRHTPLIDGHNDLPWQMWSQWRNNLSAFDLNVHQPSLMTDIPRLRQGLLGGQFWSVYIPCDVNQGGFFGGDAVQHTMMQIDDVHQLVERYPDDFSLCLTAKDVRKAFGKGKIASLIGMEGGHSINSSLPVLRQFYNLGARYMTLTHTCTLPWVDSANGPFTNNGLSGFGREVIREMNRMGMIVDISHVSNKTMLDVLETSTAPVMFSHSAAYHLAPHIRNVPDNVLDLLPANGAVVMIPFYSAFLTPSGVNSTIADVIAHMKYIADRIGPDYIGIGADLDGIPRDSVPAGLEDVSKYPALVAALLEEHFSASDIKKIMGENILRVMEGVEQVAENLQKTTQASQAVCCY